MKKKNNQKTNADTNTKSNTTTTLTSESFKPIGLLQVLKKVWRQNPDHDLDYERWLHLESRRGSSPIHRFEHGGH